MGAAGGGHFALGVHTGKAAGTEPLRHFVGRGVGRQRHRKGDDHAGLLRQRSHPLLQLGVNGVRRVVLHGLCGLSIKQLCGTRHHQLQVIVELGHRAHGGARTAHRVGLVNRNGWRHAFNTIDLGAVHAIEELSRIGAESFDIPALTFGIERVKHQARFTRTTGAGDHGELTGVKVEVEVLQVVLASAANANMA